MGGRTMPMECEHGWTVDWGDFGPCQDCREHSDRECPNFTPCPECEAESDAATARARQAGAEAWDRLAELVRERDEAVALLRRMHRLGLTIPDARALLAALDQEDPK